MLFMNYVIVAFLYFPFVNSNHQNQKQHRILKHHELPNNNKKKKNPSIEDAPSIISQLRHLYHHRNLNEEIKSDIAIDAYAHLLQIAKDKDDKPNSRATCSDGFKYANDYVARQMKKMGLIPLGGGADDGSYTAYVHIVENSVDDTICPNGIRNVVGMVQGTEFKDEYIVYAAHLDGPNNGNPQTQKAKGNEMLSNVYDNGLAVAVGLAIAKQMALNPPQRSVIFLIDAAEEGFDNILPLSVGETTADVCDKIVGTDWFMEVNEAIGISATSAKCRRCCIGAHGWIRAYKPTVTHENIKFVMNIDPLGAPYNQNNIIAALGGERSLYGANKDKNLNDFLDDIWPQNSNVDLVKAPVGALDGRLASTYNAFTTRYQGSCGNNCAPDGGIPSVWLAQPAFQKYHSGLMATFVKDLFGTLKQGKGEFSYKLYFSVDNLAALYLPSLDGMATTLLDLLTNAANSDSVSTLSYDKDKDDSITQPDLKNMLEGLDIAEAQLKNLPAPAAAEFQAAINAARGFSALLIDADLTSSPLQGRAVQLAQLLIGLLIASDFSNDNYPEKEEFWDQTYGPPPNEISEIPPKTNGDEPNEETDPSGQQENKPSVASYTSLSFAALIGLLSAMVSTVLLC